MSTIYTNIVAIDGLEDELKVIFLEKYLLKNHLLVQSIDTISQTLSEFKKTLFVYVEYPYIDKTYRDSYYRYFASKRDSFSRDAVRLSFFEEKIEESDFRNPDKIEFLQKKYLGFVIVRPTFPYVIGRSVLDPRALERDGFKLCKVPYSATVNGIKLTVNGFPHSSQDSETISCAETTIWSLLEYFGNKYPEYRPLLPSHISDTLGKYSTERLIPSNGLTAEQIAFALKEFGFGVKIYSRDQYNDEFEKIIRIYVESGIPVVGAIQNDKGIGHAVNIVGRKDTNPNLIKELSVSKIIGRNVSICEFEKMKLDYCFVDDNYPPYQLTALDSPSSYYDSVKWEGCKITSIIVPLYPKIYLEAGEAKKIAYTFLEEIDLLQNKEVILKVFLASSRSFKHTIALDQQLNTDAKELLMTTVMPKFVWIMEISTKDLMIQNQIEGMIIIDATEPERSGIIAALVENHYIAINLTTAKRISITLQPFSAYNKNLNE